MFLRRKKPAEPKLPPEWLIVGLGNPGGEYAATRHNVGFQVVDRLAQRHKIKLSKARHRALVGEGEIDGTRVVLVKPLTYMNLSGQAVAPLTQHYQVPPERVFVIADDLDLDVGRLRMRLKGSAGGHNGHKSLIHSLRTQDYPRLKIGISSSSGSTIDHVLGTFDREEIEVIREALDRAVEGVEVLVRHGATRAMNWVNEPRD